jgi:putative ABC transport system permease protein
MYAIFRNLISVVCRFKLAAALNVLGLSVAFAAFMIIMVQVDYDYSFDKCHKDYKKIFRVEWTLNSTTQTLLSRPLAELFIASSPQIVVGALTNFREEETYFHIENEDERHYFKENSLIVTPEFFDVFTFDFVEGAKEHRLSPGQVFIPLSLSRKMFGSEPAVGKQLIHSSWGRQTVMGVYRDIPNNSSVNNLMYFAMQPNENIQEWGMHNYQVYIRVNQTSNASSLFENFKRNFDQSVAQGWNFNWDEPGNCLRLTALQDIHFVTDASWDNTPKASKQTQMILLAIALLIIVIAAINFTNFSTALTPMRIKSINTQRVIGARRRTLLLSIVSEAIFISLLSYGVALYLITLFKDTPLAMLVDATLSITAHPLVIGETALIAILTGLLAGTYPAHYLTSFSPALVLKGSFGLSPKGRNMRNTLIGIDNPVNSIMKCN